MFTNDGSDLQNDGDRPTPLYSVCITCRNSVRTIERSLTSILCQLDERFEVIVVDGGSTDGTVEALERLQRKSGKLKIVCRPCSRGLGRDIAYRHSRGKYLIQGGDADAIYHPTLQSILEYYHSNEKSYGSYALFIPAGFLISTREIMDSVGGWPDLQHAEDIYVRARLMRVCTVEFRRSLYYVAVKEHIKSGRIRRLSRVKHSCVVWRDFHRALPFVDAFEVLRLRYLREGIQWLPTKLANVAVFFLGALGQYSKPRSKLHDDDLRSYMWGERFSCAAEKSSNPNTDLILDHSRAASYRAVRLAPIHSLPNHRPP